MRRGIYVYIAVGISIVMIVIVLGALLLQSLSNRRNQAKFSAAGSLFAIGDRKLHIQVSGQKEGPTVVFDHNCEYGASSLSWQMVVERASHFARVVCIDRAGYGWSEGGKYPRTNLENVEDTREMLLAANIKGPIIYVGHGYGTLNARLYASRYPKQVSGLVFIDPWHENEYDGKFPQSYVEEKEALLKTYKRNQNFSPWGLVGLMLRLQPSFRKQVAYYSKEQAQKVWAISSLSKTIKTIYSEAAFVEVGFNQIRHITSYKNKPITVVISGKLDQQPAATKQAKYEAAVDLKNLSDEGLIIIAPNSENSPPTEQPELVADAIRRMITHLKKEYV